MTDASKLPLQLPEFTTMARAFLGSAEPTLEAVAAFAGRVYQIGYEHGERDGKAEQARAFVANFGKGGQR
jgi:hypothetical protein